MADRRYTWVHRIFKRSAFAEDTVESAVEEQLTFEADHPVKFASDQRRRAILQRCDIIAKSHGATVIPKFEELVDRALTQVVARERKALPPRSS